MENKKFQEALDILFKIIPKEKSFKKILYVLSKMRCEIELSKFGEAALTAVLFSSLLELNMAAEEIQQAMNAIEECVVGLIDEFYKIRDSYCVLLLLKSRMDLIVHYEIGKDRLVKLNKIIVSVAHTFKKLNKNDHEKQKNLCGVLLYSALNEMLLSGEADMRFKSKQIAMGVKYCGLHCIDAKNWLKAIELFRNAIFLLKSVFGTAAMRLNMLGTLLKLLGLVFNNLGQKEIAKDYLEQALEVYETADDWKSDKDQEYYMDDTYDYLKNIEFDIAF